MNENHINSFFKGKLSFASVYDEKKLYCSLYCKFPNKGKRPILQTKQYLRFKSLNNQDFVWVDNVKEGKLLEINCLSKNEIQILKDIANDLKYIKEQT